MGIQKGKKLMLFVKTGASGSETWKSIGYCTNHTLSTSINTISISHKDLADNTSGNGKWQDEAIDTYTWSISTEAFYADEANGVTEADLFGYYIAGTTLDVKFGLADVSSTGVPSGGWTPKSGETMLSGKVFISSFDVNAPVDDNATYSITMTGKGAITVLS